MSRESAVGAEIFRWQDRLCSSQSRTYSVITLPRRFCTRSRSATLSESSNSTRCTSCSFTRSRGAVVLLPTDFTAAASSTDITGEQSLPRAKFQSISPFLPRAARSALGSQLARSPMVRMLRLFNLRFVAGPTNSSSSTGSGHTFCR